MGGYIGGKGCGIDDPAGGGDGSITIQDDSGLKFQLVLISFGVSFCCVLRDWVVFNLLHHRLPTTQVSRG